MRRRINEEELRVELEFVDTNDLSKARAISNSKHNVIVVYHSRLDDSGADFTVFSENDFYKEVFGDSIIESDISLDRAISIVKNELGNTEWVIEDLTQ